MKYGIIVNTNECVGCHACFTACKEENQVLPGVKWNRIDRIEHEKARVIEYFRLSCMHCEDPACMKVCPAKAIHKGPAGEVLVDHAKCIGCRMCEKACPYGAPQFADPKKTSYFGEKTPLEVIPVRPENARTPGKAEHCTLCTHRTSKGLPPACVAACATGALTFVDYDNPSPEAKALLAQARPMNEAAGTHPRSCTFPPIRTSRRRKSASDRSVAGLPRPKSSCRSR